MVSENLGVVQAINFSSLGADKFIAIVDFDHLRLRQNVGVVLGSSGTGAEAIKVVVYVSSSRESDAANRSPFNCVGSLKMAGNPSSSVGSVSGSGDALRPARSACI